MEKRFQAFRKNQLTWSVVDTDKGISLHDFTHLGDERDAKLAAEILADMFTAVHLDGQATGLQLARNVIAETTGVKPE